MMPALAGPICWGSAASAAEPLHRFDIRPQPLSRALVALATQANISIGFTASARCMAQDRGVVGQMTVAQALATLLDGSGCGYRMIDARAAEIIAAPVRKAAPPITPQADAAPPLSELVVVATRRLTPASQLAYAVSVVESNARGDLGARDTADLAATVPSMIVTNLGAGRDKILLRGLSDGPLTGRTQSTVGLYLDDVRLTYNAPEPDLRLVDMARVEVLRGPQGALYGAGSLGGVVQLVTVQPQLGVLSGSISATAATTAHGDGSNTIDGVLNVPMLSGRGAVRLVAYRDVQGGYIDDEALGIRHANETVLEGGRLAASLKLDDRWSVSARVVTQAINSADTQYAFAGAAPYARRTLVREPHDNDFLEANVSLQGDLAWGEAHWTTAVVKHRVVSRYDATDAPPVPVAARPVAFDDSDAITSVVTEGTVASVGAGPPLAGGVLPRPQLAGCRPDSVGP